MHRREFLLTTGLSFQLTAAGPLQFFNAADAALVEALCEAIIPADKDPGGKQAGVMYYIDRQLAGTLARFAPRYRAGLADLRRACESATGLRFENLGLKQQTAFLEALPPGLATFFTTVVDHAMQGYYGSPKHGGNKDGASWRMLGVAEFLQEGHSH